MGQKMTPEAVAVPPEWIQALETFISVGGTPDAGQIQMQANLWRQQCPALADQLDALAALIRASGVPVRDSTGEDQPTKPARDYGLLGLPQSGFFG